MTISHPSDSAGKPIPFLDKILIVEDEYVNFLYLREILSAHCKQILHAEYGADALKICQEHSDIVLILMDIKLPDISGYELTIQVRRLMPNVPIIAQTAYAMPGDREQSIEAGCNDYVSKPVTKEELWDKIRIWTGNK